jgi:hypothetical protein
MGMGVGLALALALAGCGGGEKLEAPKTDAAAAPAVGTATPDLENGGTVTGKVSFEGTAPAMRELDMSAVPACAIAHKTPVNSEEVLVNKNKTLKNVFVYVKAGLPAGKGWAVPGAAVELDQQGCLYSPHVIGAMAGQQIDIKNGDPVNHNIHPVPVNNPDYNQSQPPGSPDIPHSFPREEVLIPIKCNVHPWMHAFVGVVSNPFFAVTGEDGSYSLKGLPPGTYTIEIVHEKYGKQEQQVTVGAKESKTADFTVKG